MNVKNVGAGNVVLLSGGGKVFTDIAARFVRSERCLEDIIASPYDKNIVKNILDSGHLAATEFDYFIFGVEGYSRVTEVQLVRKRLASYLIKSGRPDKGGKRSFDVVLPEGINDFSMPYSIPTDSVFTEDGKSLSFFIRDDCVEVVLNCFNILDIIEKWYNAGIDYGYREEDLRYLKPQATEFKAIIGMNAHSLVDWFKIRCCRNAQTEIRDLANKMLKLCKNVKPDLFAHAGANCVTLGYCPENNFQNEKCRGKILTHGEVLTMIRQRDKN